MRPPRGRVIQAAASVATLWAGFVLAISFFEAWVKFRAPFLPKFFALDGASLSPSTSSWNHASPVPAPVGRTIFPTLNAIEVGREGGSAHPAIR